MHAGPPPSPWLQRWAHLISPGGTVLDVACGSGRHLRWLHERGFVVTGVDRDAEALQPLAALSETIVADIEGSPWPLAGRRFTAVLVTNYLWRPLTVTLLDALADGGVFIHETFADGQQAFGKPSRPEFLLRPAELITMVGRRSGMRIVAFEDGRLDGPPRCVQRIVAVAGGSRPAALAGPAGAGG